MRRFRKNSGKDVYLEKHFKSIPDKLEAIILRKINDSYIKIGNKKLKSTDTSFRFLSGDKAVTFTIPKNIEVVYSDGKRSFIFYDFDSGLLVFNKSAFPITIEEIDDLLSKNVISGLFNRIKGALEKQELAGGILKYIIVGIAFFCIGWIVHEAINPPNPPVQAQFIGGLINWLT